MKKILLVIDVQKGFITNSETNSVKEKIDKLLELNIFDYVIATQYQNYENSPISKLMGWTDLQTEDSQSLLGNAKDKNDYVLKKKTYSAVCPELLEVLTKANDGKIPECVYIVGVDTGCCVLTTATELFEKGIRPLVLSNYVASSSGYLYHKAGLLNLENLIGKYNICTQEQIETKEDLEKIYVEAKEKISLKSKRPVSSKRFVVDFLKDKKWHISFAESCTGGLAAATLVSVPDASWVLDESYVTYASESKVKLVNVKKETIEKYTVVSEEVAREMADGVAKVSNAEVGVGITGLAGPGGGTKTQPVGMVCFGFHINNKTISYTKQFGDIGRNNVREKCVEFVFDTLVKLLTKDSEK